MDPFGNNYNQHRNIQYYDVPQTMPTAPAGSWIDPLGGGVMSPRPAMTQQPVIDGSNWDNIREYFRNNPPQPYNPANGAPYSPSVHPSYIEAGITPRPMPTINVPGTLEDFLGSIPRPTPEQLAPMSRGPMGPPQRVPAGAFETPARIFSPVGAAPISASPFESAGVTYGGYQPTHYRDNTAYRYEPDSSRTFDASGGNDSPTDEMSIIRELLERLREQRNARRSGGEGSRPGRRARATTRGSSTRSAGINRTRMNHLY